jgi:ankyrin repeat protein
MDCRASKSSCLVNWTTSACWSALHMASRFGHLPIVKYLVESGADLNILRCALFLDFNFLFFSYSRSTPLMEATAAGQVDCVRFLLKKGCKVNLQEISFQILRRFLTFFFAIYANFNHFYLFKDNFYNFSSL